VVPFFFPALFFFSLEAVIFVFSSHSRPLRPTPLNVPKRTPLSFVRFLFFFGLNQKKKKKEMERIVSRKDYSQPTSTTSTGLFTSKTTPAARPPQRETKRKPPKFELTDEQKQEVREAFDLFDTDR
jgi:hypothetical protein